MKNKDDEVEYRPYKAKKYIEEYYKTQNNMIKELFDKKILTYELVSDITGIKIDVLKDMINKKIKQPDIRLRRRLHIFFNKDFYKHLGEYNSRCMDCRWRKCKQPYYVTIDVCLKYKKSTQKKEK